MTTKPDYRYVVLTIDETEHLVCVVHDHSPDWYRHVATFRNKKRAEDYAEMENDFRPGMGIIGKKETPLPGRQHDDEPAPESLRHVVEPPSALKPQEFVRRQTIVEHTRIAQVEERSGHATEFVQVETTAVPALPEPSGPVLGEPPDFSPPASNEEAKSDIPPETPPQLPSPDNSRQIAANPGNAPQTPPLDLVDAGQLEPVTEKQAKTFRVVVAITARGERAAFRNTALEAGYSSVQDAFDTLVRRGYLVRAGEYGGMYWVPLAQGEPRISDEVRFWTQTQREGLRKVCEAGGDMAAFATSIGRTESAVLARARELGIYDGWLAARKPATAGTAAEPEEITSIDLSPRQQVVLHAIDCDGWKFAARKYNIDEEKLPDILKRLDANNCIAIQDGGWKLTDHGKKVLEQIRVAGVPDLAPLSYKGKEVKISTPVVRRVNGDGKEVKPAEDAKTYTLFDMETYLRHKRHTVTRLTGGEFIIDGARRTKVETLMLVNSHRQDSELPPKAIDQVK